MSLREPNAISWLKAQQLGWQKEDFEERMTLSPLDWMLQVWGMALLNEREDIAAQVEELMILKVDELWGPGHQHNFNRKSWVASFRHPEGLEKTFYVNDME